MKKIEEILTNLRNMNATSHKQWDSQTKEAVKKIKQLIKDSMPEEKREYHVPSNAAERIKHYPENVAYNQYRKEMLERVDKL